MRRISTTTSQVDKFGSGKNGFTDGSVIGGVPSTDLQDVWYDHVQEEIATVIEAAGIVLSSAAYNQLLTALRSSGVFQTPAQFDSTTKVATTAFVRASQGSIGTFLAPAASAVLTLAQLGALVVYNGALAGQTLSLPAVATVPAGYGYWMQNVASVAVTIKANAAEVINQNSVGVGAIASNSFSLGIGESTFLVSNGAAWYEQQGSRSSTINSLGCVSQSWQNVSASRTFNVTYTNSTGRAIFVSAGGLISGPPGFYILVVNGVAAAQAEVPAGSRFAMTVVVPAGGTYQLSKGQVDTFVSANWSELR